MKNFINTSVLFGVTGRWHIRGGGYLTAPPDPPQGLSERQITIVSRHLEKQGFALLRDRDGRLIVGVSGTRPPRNPFEPIDPIRAARLQAFRPGDPRNDAARYATWLRQRSKPSG